MTLIGNNRKDLTNKKRLGKCARRRKLAAADSATSVEQHLALKTVRLDGSATSVGKSSSGKWSCRTRRDCQRTRSSEPYRGPPTWLCTMIAARSPRKRGSPAAVVPPDRVEDPTRVNDDPKPAIVTTTSRKLTKLLRAEERAEPDDPEAGMA